MFSWVGEQFNSALNDYAIGVVKSLMAGIAPIALVALTIWIVLYGWAVVRNEVSETLPVFVWKMFKIGLVLIFSLQASVYTANVADAASSLTTDVAKTFLTASADPTAVTSPYALLDAFNDQASLLVLDLMKDAGITRVDLVFAAVVTALGNVIFLCVALFVVTLAKVLMTFVIAVGPVFILCLAFRPTVRFFDSWLSMLLNTVVMSWFAFFALGLSIYMGQAMVTAVQTHGGFAGPTFNVVGESMKYCIVMVLLAIICFQAPSLASALTGGPAVQQGFQMIQNAMIAGGLRSRPTGMGAAGMAGGAINAGTGMPYAAGHAAGAAVRQGYNTTRLAAYQLAALRGRK